MSEHIAVERIAPDVYRIHSTYDKSSIAVTAQDLRDLFELLLRHMPLIEDEAVARAEATMLLRDSEPRR